jgi:hypothetical protein
VILAGGRLSDLLSCSKTASSGSLAAGDVVEQVLLAVGGPHRPGAHAEELADLDLPAGVLRRHARQHRMVRGHLNRRAGQAGDLARNQRDFALSGQADAGQAQAGLNAARRLDAAIQHAAAARRLLNLDPQSRRRARHVVRQAPGAFVERRGASHENPPLRVYRALYRRALPVSGISCVQR